MAKSSGLGARFYVDGNELSGDVGSLSRISGGVEALPVTGIDVEAYERITGLRNGGMTWQSWFNPARAHLVLAELPTADSIVTYCHRSTIGSPAASCIGKQINYDGTREANGNFPLTVDVQSNGYGLEWGNLLTAASRTDSAATNGAAVSFPADGAFGLQAYLHVEAFTGTDVTIKIQHSNDGSTGWADVTGGAFTQVTGSAPLSQRIQTARDLTVQSFLRAVTVTTGGFTSVEFMVMALINQTLVNF